MMPTQAKPLISPVDGALLRLLDSAARAAEPTRMAREVQIIIGEWRKDEEDAVVKDRTAARHEMAA